MTFPREIVDLFVSELVATKDNLAPLLWVSPIFNASARHAIFQHVRLIFDVASDQNKKVALLHDVIQGDPSVLNSIRALYIGPRREPDHMLQDLESPVTQSLLALLRILATGPAIRILTISGSWMSFDMALLPKEVVTHLLSLRSIPSLRSLIFHGLTNLTQNLITGVGPRSEDKIISLVMTESVRIAPITVDQAPDESILDSGDLEIRSDDPCGGKEGENNILPALTNLQLGGTNRFLRSLCCQPGASIPHIHFPLLKSFSIMTFNDWDPYEVATVKKFLKEAPLLTQLELRYSFSDIVNNTRLEPLYGAIREAPMLSDFVLVCTGYHEHFVHLENMKNFLEKLGHLPSLKTLRLALKIRSYSFQTASHAPEDVQASYERFEKGLQEMRRVFRELGSLSWVKFTVDFMLKDNSDTSVPTKDIDRFKEIFDQYAVSDDIRFIYKLANIPPVE